MGSVSGKGSKNRPYGPMHRWCGLTGEPPHDRAGHALRLVDFVGVPLALLLDSKNPSRSTFSTRTL